MLRNNVWCNCKLTLAEEANGECLIAETFDKNAKQKTLKLTIYDITCICRVYNQTCSNCFAIHTALRTMERNYLMLSASSEKELNEWITSLNTSCQKARKCEGPPKPSAVWCTSSRGDVFFSDSKDESGECTSKNSLVLALMTFSTRLPLSPRLSPERYNV